MYYSLIFLAVVLFISNPYNLYPVMILASVFVLLNICKYIFKLDSYEFILLMFVFYLGLIGESFTLGLYTKLFYYDKLVHLIGFGMISLVVNNRIKDYGLKKYDLLFTFLIVLGISAIVEVYEYIYDVFFNQGMQGVFDSQFHTLVGGLTDTILDLIFGGVGILTFLGIKYNIDNNKNTLLR